VNGAVGENQQRDQIIGDALPPQIRQDRIIHDTAWICETAAQRHTGAAHFRHRTVAEYVAFQQFEAAVADHRILAGRPDETAADDFRMQGTDENDDARQRQAGRDQPLAEFGENILRQRLRPRAVDQPVDDRLRCGELRVHRHDLIGDQNFIKSFASVIGPE
jgi:hypothetical protein